MFNCPQCSYQTETLNEGYCEDCRKENQNSLDLHNAEYNGWQKLSDNQRQERIKESLR